MNQLRAHCGLFAARGSLRVIIFVAVCLVCIARNSNAAASTASSRGDAHHTPRIHRHALHALSPQPHEERHGHQIAGKKLGLLRRNTGPRQGLGLLSVDYQEKESAQVRRTDGSVNSTMINSTGTAF